MQVIPNIPAKYLTKLKEFISTSKDLDPIDLLPWLREIYPEPEYQSLMEYALNKDLSPHIHNGQDPLIQVISTTTISNEEYIVPVTADIEPDEVIYQIRFYQEYLPQLLNPTEENLPLLFTYLVLIMLSDCTNCCNALKYILLTKGGIYSQGDVSETYHS